MMLDSNHVSFNTTYTVDTHPQWTTPYTNCGDPVVFKSNNPGLGFRNIIDRMRFLPKVSRVIFSPPATILFFTDGDKVVVKCQEGRTYDPFDGVANAMLKKIYANDNLNYKSEMRRLVKMGEKPEAKSK